MCRVYAHVHVHVGVNVHVCASHVYGNNTVRLTEEDDDLESAEVLGHKEGDASESSLASSSSCSVPSFSLEVKLILRNNQSPYVSVV